MDNIISKLSGLSSDLPLRRILRLTCADRSGNHAHGAVRQRTTSIRVRMTASLTLPKYMFGLSDQKVMDNWQCVCDGSLAECFQNRWFYSTPAKSRIGALQADYAKRGSAANAAAPLFSLNTAT